MSRIRKKYVMLADASDERNLFMRHLSVSVFVIVTLRRHVQQERFFSYFKLVPVEFDNGCETAAAQSNQWQ